MDLGAVLSCLMVLPCILVTTGTGGTLESYLVPLVLVKQSQGLLLCARAGL
jgi:hypothetical protein